MRYVSYTVLCLSISTLIGCGGGDNQQAGGGGGGGTTNDQINQLNAFRNQTGGVALASVTSHSSLETAAIRHAGWQAIDDVTQLGTNLNHYEPRNNTLFTANNFDDRIRAANGGVNISGYNSYYEDIASTAGSTSVSQLWNTVYHRIPMMRHRATHLGYGDMALARAKYPAAGVPLIDEWSNTPSGNGYATYNWAGYAVPAITLSYWPGNSTTGVPRIFYSDTEGPDPMPSRNQVGCPLHIICPESAGEFTVVNITMTGPGPTNIPLYVLAGGTSPSGAAGQVSTLVADNSLARGELFAMPIPSPTNTGLAANTSYTYNMTLKVNGNDYVTGNVSFTTAP